MKYDVFWRGKTYKKMNKLINASREQVVIAVDSLLEKGEKEIRFKVKRIE